MESFVFNPQDLITGPFITCPRCGGDRFGVLMINGNALFRRCQNSPCGHSQMFMLPPLHKKVIYIDQFGISNMMKTLDPSTKGHSRTVTEPLWRDMFELLDVLCKAQLVICPDSDEHRTESMLAPFYDRLKRMYELFSHGVTFHDSQTIRRLQLTELITQWVKSAPPSCSLDPASVTSTGLHQWQDRFSVTVTMPHNDDVLGELRAIRQQVHQEAQNAFTYWKTENLSFDERQSQAVREYGLVVLKQVMEWREKMQVAQFGPKEPDPRDLCPPFAVQLFLSLVETLRQSGVPESQCWARVVEFLNSGVPGSTPYRQVSSALYAVLAMNAQNGQMKPPNQGTTVDIMIVASYLPYCAAMFIDNKCRALLDDIPKNRALPYSTNVFSPNTGREFLEYLRSIQNAAPANHWETVHGVYGKDYLEPYTTIFASSDTP